jgi:extracellular elastinolytic metalloproteinase
LTPILSLDRMHSLSRLLAFGAVVAVQAVDLETLRFKSIAEYVGSADAGSASRFRHLKRETYVETATDLVKEVVPDATFKISEDHYTGTNGISHVYARQTIHDVEVDGAFFNVNVHASQIKSVSATSLADDIAKQIDKDGHVFSYGNSFYTGDVPEQTPLQKRDSIISPVEALGVVKETLELSIEIPGDSEAEPVADEIDTYTVNGVSSAISDPKAKLVYLIKPDGNLALAWRVETELDETKYSSYVDVDAETPKVVAVQDHVDWFTYEV